MEKNYIEKSEKHENEFKKQLFQLHKEKVELLDNCIEILSKILDSIKTEIGGSQKTDLISTRKWWEQKNDTFVCEMISDMLLFLAEKKIYGARKLLLSGYLESMLANLRGVVETLFYSDICRKSVNEAKKWLRKGYIEKSHNLSVHERISFYRSGETWKFLCSGGAHPGLIGFKTSMIASLVSLASEKLKIGAVKENAQAAQLFLIYLDDFHKMIKCYFGFMIQLIIDFILYLREIFWDMYIKNDAIESELEIVMSEYKRIAKIEFEYLKKRKIIH